MLKPACLHIPVAMMALLSVPLTDLNSRAAAADADTYFHTPSANIWCVYHSEWQRLRCDVEQRNWKNWGCKPYGCFGPSFVLPMAGPARPKEVSDSLIGSSDFVLNYGSRLSFGSITCLSETTGLTCTNRSGGYLHLNREFYVAR